MSDGATAPLRPTASCGPSRAALAVTAWLLAAMAMAPPLLLADRLPDPLAGHWGWHGQPDGAFTLVAHLVMLAVLSVIPALVVTALVIRPPRHRGVAVMPCAIAGFVGGLGAAVSFVVVDANLDAPVWWQAAPVDGTSLLPPIAVALVVAVLMGRWGLRVHTDSAVDLPAFLPLRSWLAPGPGQALGPPADPPAAAAFAAEVAAAVAAGRWEGRTRAVWPWAMLIGQGLAGIVLMATAVPFVGGLLLLIAFVAVPFTSVRVVVDARGMCAGMGPIGWPAVRLSMDQIAGASAEELHPMQWGGWGYRGSLRLAHQAAIVLRAGPALMVDIVPRGRFGVTVDGAVTGAAVLDALRQAHRPS